MDLIPKPIYALPTIDVPLLSIITYQLGTFDTFQDEAGFDMKRVQDEDDSTARCFSAVMAMLWSDSRALPTGDRP